MSLAITNLRQEPVLKTRPISFSTTNRNTNAWQGGVVPREILVLAPILGESLLSSGYDHGTDLGTHSHEGWWYGDQMCLVVVYRWYTILDHQSVAHQDLEAHYYDC